MTASSKHRVALALAAWLAAGAGVARADQVTDAMPPFLVGGWKLGKQIMFADARNGYSPQEFDTLRHVEGTMFVTQSSIAFRPGYVPHPGGRKVRAVASESPLSAFAQLDPDQAAGTPLADGNATMARVSVTPSACPPSGVSATDAGGHRICAEQLFFSPDGFRSVVYLWEPGGVIPLEKLHPQRR